MSRIRFMLLDACIAAVLFLPFFYLMNRRSLHNGKRTALFLLFAVYLAGMYSVVGLPDLCYYRISLRWNLTPFAYMFSAYKTTLLNVLLFMPFGFFLPLLWKEFQTCFRTVLAGFSLSLFIELLQIFTLRATDINDLMTNTLGTFLGWVVARAYLHFRPEGSLQGAVRELWILLGMVFGVMYFIHPLLSRFLFPLL